MVGRSWSTNSTRSGVGMGSKLHVVGFEDVMIFLTSTSETGLKKAKVLLEGGRVKAVTDWPTSPSSSFLMSVIFFEKKVSKYLGGVGLFCVCWVEARIFPFHRACLQ